MKLTSEQVDQIRDIAHRLGISMAMDGPNDEFSVVLYDRKALHHQGLYWTSGDYPCFLSAVTSLAEVLRHAL